MIRLGVNIDHVATLRQVRRAREPDPVWAAAACELAGAQNITIHLREDRRHIQDRDLELLRKTVRTRLNLEMANVPEMVRIALKIRPDQVTLVPEKRQELTTEGGLDVLKAVRSLLRTLEQLKKKGIQAGLFVDPDLSQVEAAQKAGARFVELHTGRFANAKSESDETREFQKLWNSAEKAHALGLGVHAGHGLHYLNIHRIVRISHLEEVNIGHAIVSRAIFVGLENAVRKMVELIHKHQIPSTKFQT